MGNVMVIPAKRQVGNTARQQDAKPKLRVAAYCRVSTDSDEQATSYDAQVETAYEIRNCDWSSDVCSSDLIRNGNLPVSTRMMVFPAPTPKNVRTSTV